MPYPSAAALSAGAGPGHDRMVRYATFAVTARHRLAVESVVMQTSALGFLACIATLVTGCSRSSNVASPTNSPPMSTANADAEDRAIAALVRKGASLSVNGQGNVTNLFLADSSFNDLELKHFAHF